MSLHALIPEPISQAACLLQLGEAKKVVELCSKVLQEPLGSEMVTSASCWYFLGLEDVVFKATGFRGWEAFGCRKLRDLSLEDFKGLGEFDFGVWGVRFWHLVVCCPRCSLLQGDDVGFETLNPKPLNP